MDSILVDHSHTCSIVSSGVNQSRLGKTWNKESENATNTRIHGIIARLVNIMHLRTILLGNNIRFMCDAGVYVLLVRLELSPCSAPWQDSPTPYRPEVA